MLTIIRETKSDLVVLKPYGMDAEHEVPAALAAQLGGQKEDYYCIHRLDKTAAGLLVYGRNKTAAAVLSKAVQDNALKKSYQIVVDGCPSEQEGDFIDLLYKDRIKQKMFPVKKMRHGVKEARLHYTVLTHSENDNHSLSLIQVHLDTGRFHQIRVQFASRHMPLVGDGKYGSRISSPHLALFCNELSYPDPVSGETVSLQVSIPDEFPWTCFPVKTIY